LVIPAIVRLAAVELLTAQIPWFARVMVTVVPDAVALPVQWLNPPPVVVTEGVAGTVKAELKATVMVSPAARAPAELVVNPAVQVAVLFAVWVEPEKVTLDTDVPITTVEAGLTAVVSLEVFTLKVLAA
jgi:hypothetical protein